MVLSVTHQLDHYVYFWPPSYAEENFVGFGVCFWKTKPRAVPEGERVVQSPCKHNKNPVFCFRTKKRHRAFHSARVTP